MKTFIANWKMNGSISQLKLFCDELNCASLQSCNLILALPSVYLLTAKKLIKNDHIHLASQTLSPHSHGAYTGQISAPMLKEIGCQYALVGHSERRDFESNEDIEHQIHQCITHNITPILCFGETHKEREQGSTNHVLLDQIQFAINQPQISQHILLAYEPRWAIGTGSPPSTNEIKSILSFLKEQTTVPILYGGSVSRDNAKNILTTGVNGLLIGGASLDCNHLLDIIAQYQLV
ncbi:MAG: triose-phosphate isomerase [Legionellales bacterium]|nr:triose-phosphate isomerase [Legionellales bacterium]OUX68263.1 MAG: triose-phosphate isomerase [bacterium TMED178]|tara:strand:+ start:2835 stop:3539 length:705 start_codon:yes stop_codon:yes gene_type:complete